MNDIYAMAKKTIPFDLDGVIHSFENGWGDGTLYGEPGKDVKWGLEILINHGFKPVIVTARDESDFEMIKEWLKKWGLPDLPITNRKIPGLIYPDDRGFRWTNMKDFVAYLI